ncbi:hypothetical protein OPT61_g5470 [Boeremia exigua]|uniref:Uncharacterized protein n=1 Tax=Boeremia exigua TaxID=749465 RepID=A0ACC2IAA9_9PLEO|nr:hypothetical protein OPT61_g5470 [Boeremia exigua]
MVFSVVAPVVSVFDESLNAADLDRSDHGRRVSYQDLPAEVTTLDNSPRCKLVTLTFGSSGSVHPPSRIVERIHSSIVGFLTVATQTTVYTSLYSHSADVQPGGLPEITEGDDGCGGWLACVLVGGDVDQQLSNDSLEGVEGQVDEWLKRMRLDGSTEGVNIRTGVSKGDVFMS